MGNLWLFSRLSASALLIMLLAGLVPPFSTSKNTSLSSARAAYVQGRSDYLVRKDRLALFNEVWSEINERYYDPEFNGIDWVAIKDRYRPKIEWARNDAEFYGALKLMVGELRDAHTRFHTPRERLERERLQGVSSGLFVYEVEGQHVVVSVDPDSEAAVNGVKPGMVVREVDGRPVDAVLADFRRHDAGSSSDRAARLRLYRRLLGGEPDSTLTLGLTVTNGATINVTLTRRTVSDGPRVRYQVLPSGYGYVKLNVWKPPIHKEFKSALQRLRDRPGLIIDLRGNPGGEVNEVLKVAGYFFRNKTRFGRFITRAGRQLELFSSESDFVYDGAVAILINEASGSGSEMFAGVLQEVGRAVIIGRQSCGCLLGIAKFRKVRGGGEIAISELGYISPHGRRVEGAGVVPNETVAMTILDLQRGRDPTIGEAENQLRAPLKSSSEHR